MPEGDQDCATLRTLGFGAEENVAFAAERAAPSRVTNNTLDVEQTLQNVILVDKG